MKTLIVLFMGIFLAATTALAANYIDADELKPLLIQKKDLVIVDIQPPQDFVLHHLAGSIETNAFPAKTPDERQRLDKTLATIQKSSAPVIVVCPRGKTGAKNAYDYLVSKGVPENRLLILDGGVSGWPFKELFLTGRP